jgi:hypothetical protein
MIQRTIATAIWRSKAEGWPGTRAGDFMFVYYIIIAYFGFNVNIGKAFRNQLSSFQKALES